MSRSKWKGPFVQRNLLKNNSVSIPMTVWSRSSVILEQFLNKKVLVHNGKSFRVFYIKNKHVGFKFGEFSFTRKYKKKSSLTKKKK